MNTMKMKFNRNGYKLGKKINQPTQEEVKSTPSLWNASLDDALKYGGDLTREAIGAMNLRHDRKHIVVDTKVSMLLPGFYPAIPGWHTDGVPRGSKLKPESKGTPNIHAQEMLSDTRFHLIVTGSGCLTKFCKQKDVELDINRLPDFGLYKSITNQMKEKESALDIVEAPSCTAVEFDWWELHTAQQAKKPEWRFLIRVTETDHTEPQSDLRQIIRTQQQVYVPEVFGW